MSSQDALEDLQTVRDLLRYAVTCFNQADLFFGHGQPDALDEASFLIGRGLQLPLERLDLFLDARLTYTELQRLLALIDTRVNKLVPSAYLLKEAWLQGYRFTVDERVIIPRSFIGELLRDGLHPWISEPECITDVLDLCTGSGCLAIMAAECFEHAQVDAADISPDALAVARGNIVDYGLSARVQAIESDVFKALHTRRYDLILCNPPYVTEAAMEQLPQEYRHEPALALAAGADGMRIVRQILQQARQHLKPDGLLIVEVGDGRAELERQFPSLPFTWLTTSAGDDMVFMLKADELPE